MKKEAKGNTALASAFVLLCVCLLAVAGNTLDRLDASLGSDVYFTQYALNFGGSNSDGFASVTAVDDGFVAVGQSAQTSFGDGNWTDITGKGGYDAIIVKYGLSGDVIWSKNFGGSGSDQFTCVTAMDDGFIAVGNSEETSFGNGNWTGITGKGGYDAIIVKYGLSGDIVWSKNFGGSGDDIFTSVTAADDGFIAVGNSEETSFGNGNWTGITGKGGYDAIIVKYNANGNFLWGKHIGGSAAEIFNGVTVVDDCFVAVGYSAEASFGNGDWAGLEGRGGNDAIAVLYSVDGDVLWKKNFGGSGQEIYFGAYTMADGFVAVGVSQENSFGNGDFTGLTGRGNNDAILVIYSLSDQPPTYSVTYNLNGGTGTAPTKSPMIAGATFQAAAASEITPPLNKQFKEWNTSVNGGGISYAVNATVTVPDFNLFLYAIWEDIPQIKITSQPETATVSGQMWSYTPITNPDGATISVVGASWVSSDGTTVSGTAPLPANGLLESFSLTITASRSGYISATQSVIITVFSTQFAPPETACLNELYTYTFAVPVTDTNSISLSMTPFLWLSYNINVVDSNTVNITVSGVPQLKMYVGIKHTVTMTHEGGMNTWDVTVTMPTYAVIFDTVGGNGTLTATVDDISISTGSQVDDGKDIVFTATPDSGFRVKEWKLGNVVVPGLSSNTFTVQKISASVSVTAEFEPMPPSHIISFDGIGNGTLIATVDGAGILTGSLVEEGKDVVFTATPSNGFHVKEWKLDNIIIPGLTSNTFTLQNISVAGNVTVEFELMPTSYMVLFNSIGSGTLTATVDGIGITTGSQVDGGKDVVFTAMPSNGFHVKEWKFDNVVISGLASNTFTLQNISVAGNVTVEFTLTSSSHTVLFNSIGGGTLTATVDDISISTGSQVDDGKDVVFTATPSNGFRIKEWKLDNIAITGHASNTFTLQNISAVGNVTVEFEQIMNTVTFNVKNGTGGDITAKVGSAKITSTVLVTMGSDVMFTANPTNGWQVKDWYVDGVSIGGRTFTYTVSDIIKDTTVTVEFEQIMSIVTFNVKNGTGGDITAKVGSAKIASTVRVTTGSDVVFTANPTNGWQVKDWYVDGVSIGGRTLTYTLKNLSKNTTVTAEFELMPPSHVVSFNSIGDGKLVMTVEGASVPAGASVEDGKSVVFTALPNNNFRIKEWRADGTVVPGHTSSTLTLPDISSAADITVEFEPNTYDLYPNADSLPLLKIVGFVLLTVLLIIGVVYLLIRIMLRA